MLCGQFCQMMIICTAVRVSALSVQNANANCVTLVEVYVGAWRPGIYFANSPANMHLHAP